MSLWMNDGSLVIDSQGRLVNCTDCPCEEEQTGTADGLVTVHCNSEVELPVTLFAEVVRLSNGSSPCTFPATQTLQMNYLGLVSINSMAGVNLGTRHWWKSTTQWGPTPLGAFPCDRRADIYFFVIDNTSWGVVGDRSPWGHVATVISCTSAITRPLDRTFNITWCVVAPCHWTSAGFSGVQTSIQMTE